jgi:AraC-like DNA-binding protein
LKKPDIMYEGADILQSRAPQGPLAPFISAFVHRRDARGGAVVMILPETRASIQIFTADPYWLRETAEGAAWRAVPPVGFWGPRLNWAYGYARRRLNVFAVGLTPVGVRALARRPVGAFVNQTPPLADIDAALARALGDIATSADHLEAFAAGAGAALSNALAGAPAGIPRVSDALERLARTGNVEPVAAEYGLSDRQFRRLFVAEFGAAPKLYQRALRLDQALKALHPRPWEKNGEETAPDFADQSHMIREFAALAGMTPKAYVESKRRHGDQILRSVVVEKIPPPEGA